MRLVDSLIAKFPTAKRQTFKRWVEGGRVIVNGHRAKRVSMEIDAGAEVKILPERKIAEANAAAMRAQLPFGIVYEDEDVLVIDKPPGLLTSTTPREERPTAVRAVRDYLGREPGAGGVVHRLDRDASGLLVFSKNNAALTSLKRQFFRHTVDRVYAALVSPPPRKPSGRLESFLIEYPDGSVHTKRGHGGLKSITDYLTTETRGEMALLRVKLQTGRKHQIRAQFAEAGFPIVGDRLYRGKHVAAEVGWLMLSAIELAFDHPRTGERKSFSVPLPGRMAELLKAAAI